MSRNGKRRSRNRRLRLLEKICARHQTRPRFYFPSSPLWTTEECRSPLRRLPVPLFLRSFVRYPPLKTAKSLPLSAVRPLGRIVNRRRRIQTRPRASPPRSSCVLYIRHFLHSLTHSLCLSRSLLSRSGLPSFPPASKVGGRPLVIRNMPIKVIWTLRLLFPSLQTADDNHQPPRGGSERQRKG